MTQPKENKRVPAADQCEMFTSPTISRESGPEVPLPVEDRQGERQAFQTIIAEFKKLIGPVQNVTAIKLGLPDSLEKLDDTLTRLPSGDAFGQKIDELRKKAADAVARARRERIQNFGIIQTNFLRGVEAQGHSYIQTAKGWRIGRLELGVQAEQAQCRWLFNREVLSSWLKISCIEDLQHSMTKYLEILNKVALPESGLADVFWEAYQECVRLRQGGKANPDLIALPRFYRQLRLTLVAQELAQKPDKRLSYVDFPKWAFLYNLDLYRKLSSSIPKEKRLLFQTGSQKETEGWGMVINGLDPSQDYKKMCYILKGS